MITMDTQMVNHQLVAALDSTDVSVRLAAELNAGSGPLRERGAGVDDLQAAATPVIDVKSSLPTDPP